MRYSRVSKLMTAYGTHRLQNFLAVEECERDASRPDSRGIKAALRLNRDAWHKHLYKQDCNQSAPASVISNSVDALSITWMILTQARWLWLRSSTMMKQLARWCGGFIRWWAKSSERIGRGESPRRTFAK